MNRNILPLASLAALFSVLRSGPGGLHSAGSAVAPDGLRAAGVAAPPAAASSRGVCASPPGPSWCRRLRLHRNCRRRRSRPTRRRRRRRRRPSGPRVARSAGRDVQPATQSLDRVTAEALLFERTVGSAFPWASPAGRPWRISPRTILIFPWTPGAGAIHLWRLGERRERQAN